MNWIQHPVILEGERVKLVPLESEHIPILTEIAKDTRIWQFMTINGAEGTILATNLKSAILKRASGEQYAFVVIDKVSNKIIGSTMFHNIFPEHKKLEIGWTWYQPDYWRTGYNRECKLLLLTYCFETLGTLRVQFQVDKLNLRSQEAVKGIGASFEGFLRNDRLRANGTQRTSDMLSIIAEEWNEVKKNLISKLAHE